MAITRKTIDYAVYPPQYNAERHTCHDVRTVVKARLAGKRLGIGSRVRRNINLNEQTAAT
jgi:hypothetical protein